MTIDSDSELSGMGDYLKHKVHHDAISEIGKKDFTFEGWINKDGRFGKSSMILDGKIDDVRVTKGAIKYNLPWYRKLLMKLIGRSHLSKKKPYVSPDGWTHIPITVSGYTISFYYSRKIDGVDFQCHDIMDKDNKLIERHLIRTDQMKG